MTKQEMRIEFFRAKECLRNALLSRGLGYIGDESFYKEIQNIWTKMNDLTPKFK